jgi:type III secretory pathway component EscS
MLSLGSRDAQLADEVAEVLVELAADELLPVRLAALNGLLTWAGQHRQRRLAAKQSREEQQQQLQGQRQVQAMEVDQAPVAQQPQPQPDEAAEADNGDGEEDEEGILAEDADMQQDSVEDVQEPSDSQQQREQQQQQQPDTPGAAIAAAGPAAGHNFSGKAARSAATSTAAPAPAKQPSRPSKKRKGDLPPWGADGIAAGVAALRDSHAQVRCLALQLLALLPPANMQAIVGLLQGLVSCCEQHQQQHWQAALAVVHVLAQQRTAMVAKSCQNICKLLAKAVRGPAAGASGDPSAAVAAAAAAAHSPIALQLLSELLLATARLKASMLPALQQQVEKQGLVEAAALQPLLAQLEEMRQQRLALQQQQQL